MNAVNLTRGQSLADDLEVAGTIWRRFMGLMLRPSLAPGRGLWFPGDNGIHMFFMRFAIDAVFLGRPEVAPQDGAGSRASDAAAAAGQTQTRRVVAAKRRLRPWLGIVPLVPSANGVLELPAGTIDATGTEVGDVVQLS